MASTTFEDDDVDYEDETPFLKNDDDDVPRHKTSSLPKMQIAVLLSAWVAESVMDHSISPYLNELVRGLPIVGGDERKVGYYTGIIQSVHHAAEAATALYWNRLSDHVGRKPVLLTCLAGTIASILSFGLSRSFWALVISRGMHGALKGNIGIVTSVIAELTNETNIARGFSLLPMTWAFGYVIGPFIGGIFSRPQDRWPSVFSNPFWVEYPYFLPCLISATYACVSFVIITKFFEETVKLHPGFSNSDPTREEPGDTPDPRQMDTQNPLPLRCLLTRPVLISVANYAMLAFLGMVPVALMPLIWSTSIGFGGLGLSPASIGLWLSVYGCMNGMFQFAVFPRAIGRFGPWGIFVTSISVFAVVYVMFPLENLVLRRSADNPAWVLILAQLTALSVSEMGYITMFMYLSSAAPSKRSLGATNGLAQSVASFQRTVGPAVADWLFAFSITNNVLGGNFVYVVLLSLVGVGLYVAMQLPRCMWARDVGWIPLN